MTGTKDEVRWRTQCAVYGIGLFSTSIFQIASVIVPLYVYTMDPTPLMFGLVFSAAHILPLILSIHAGALMDRWDRRLVLVGANIVRLCFIVAIGTILAVRLTMLEEDAS